MVRDLGVAHVSLNELEHLALTRRQPVRILTRGSPRPTRHLPRAECSKPAGRLGCRRLRAEAFEYGQRLTQGGLITIDQCEGCLLWQVHRPPRFGGAAPVPVYLQRVWPGGAGRRGLERSAPPQPEGEFAYGACVTERRRLIENWADVACDLSASR